jgi:hypothetical protein
LQHAPRIRHDQAKPQRFSARRHLFELKLLSRVFIPFAGLLVGRYYDPATGQFLSVDPEVAETGQPYAYTGDDPVNGVDPLGLCSTSGGTFLVPGACHFTSKSWVAQVEGGFQLQSTQAMESGLAKFWGNIEEFGDTLSGNPLAYCGPGSSEEAALANVLDFGAGAAGGDPEIDADEEEDSISAAQGGETAATASSYTYGQYVDSIEQNGLRSGTYATPISGLSPLQAQIELSLSPERGLPDVEVQIDLAALRNAGYTIPGVTRVSNVIRGASGRVYSMAGGGYEMRFPYSIPPQFIKVVSK